MKNQIRKIFVLAVVLIMSVVSMAGCGASSGSDDANASGGGDGISIFNSKMEIQEQMLQMAEEYTKKTGVKVEVYYSGDTVSAHLATRYASNNPYTISMVDPKDIYSLAEEHAVDLSNEKWVKDTDNAVAIGDKVYGYPVCVEGRGIIYNKDAIEKITGKEFVPSDYKTLDKFEGLLKQLKKGGMEAPTGIMKEDWSLAAHYLAQIYEEREDPDLFVRELSSNKKKIVKDEKFNSLMDAFDVLMKYNYSKNSAISAEREVTEQKLAEGEIAFMFGGNWDWSVISAYDYTENMGMMPIPQNMKDGTNEKIVGGSSKCFFVDSSKNTSEEQRQQALDFLNWLTYDEEGMSFTANDCALVPAFKNNTLPVSDPLSASVKKFADSGMLIQPYNFLPDDHLSILGAQFQKYLAGMCDRKEFGNEVQKYWKTKTLQKHEQ